MRSLSSHHSVPTAEGIRHLILLHGSQPCPCPLSPKPCLTPSLFLTHFRVSHTPRGLCTRCCPACESLPANWLSHLSRGALSGGQAFPGSGPPRHPDLSLRVYPDYSGHICGRPHFSAAGRPAHLCSSRDLVSVVKARGGGRGRLGVSKGRRQAKSTLNAGRGGRANPAPAAERLAAEDRLEPCPRGGRPLSFLGPTPRTPIRLLRPGAGRFQAPSPQCATPSYPESSLGVRSRSLLIGHWDGGQHPSPILREAPALLPLCRLGVLGLRPWAVASGAVRVARSAARPGGSGRAGRAPPAPQAARALARSRTAGQAYGRGSAGGGAIGGHALYPAHFRQGPPTSPQKEARLPPVTWSPGTGGSDPAHKPTSSLFLGAAWSPRDPRRVLSPLLHRQRVALKVAEAREQVDQTAQGRRTWQGRAGAR